MQVLVTGASGFIGRHLVERLRAAGDDVRALVRDSSRVGHLQEHGVRLISAKRSRDRLAGAARSCCTHRTCCFGPPEAQPI